jgi:hypothetical protein
MSGERIMDGTSPEERRRARTLRMQELVVLAAEIQCFLVPVKPAAEMRRRLHADLVAEAGHRSPGRVARRLQPHRGVILLVAAAAGSLASIAGVIAAIVQRSKHARFTHTA